ncbi:putative serine/threonine-protein kinase nek2 [Cucumis melo var. makuwa]|uniref:Serine/threonine-protein kinase nek2 n=1 Tax=Cucumis melo var. makuwa TaxID=1194695 RepID=A0A5D3D1W5_CUCMM|nr:putative serine/threonine-protein kinase nek2 [Cucumis melo var. makuwa]TYK17842.1 putative serine/threonine-protein kinase nek2 [Cucumis melo var. makuwa]
MWKKTRVNKQGQYDNDDIQQVLHKIDEISMNIDSSSMNRHYSNDVLTQALGTKEHNGHVHGVGGYVTPTTYFHSVKKTSKDEANILAENEELRRLVERELIKMPTEKEVVCESTSTLPLALKWILRYAEKYLLQVGSTAHGYYVMKYMKEIVNRGSIVISDSIDTRKPYSQARLDEVRVELAEFLGSYI